ncbi:flavodoxin [Sedimentibacter sp.]|uniref:flavodoxin n=1 Tax=Sedimentibacter sp. TaxID=1960295 RepID=UPI0028A8964B|nr:flavodoxin [Sedimentibacter sp.]
MNKIAVVFWSGTGNTESMAEYVAKGVKEAGAEVTIYSSAEFNMDALNQYDAVAFGCPSMGDEVLEESEFEPMFSECKPGLKGKKIALFGSYGWGDGEWMRNWEEDCRSLGAVLVIDSVICNETPDQDAQNACIALGKALAS